MIIYIEKKDIFPATISYDIFNPTSMHITRDVPLFISPTTRILHQEIRE